MEEKHIIWSDINLDYEDWRADLESEYPDKTEAERFMLMCEINNDYLDDERVNLNVQMPRSILAIADIGRWNGRFSGYAEIKSGNIQDCLFTNCDMSEWYVDALGDFRCTAIHHDGRNYYLYRAIKSTATDEQIDRLKSLIYDGKATRRDITRVTERLGDAISAVYGWNIPRQRRPVSLER